VAAGASSLLTVTVTPGTNPASTGLTVTGNLLAIGGSATQSFFDDGTNGDSTPNDNVFSFAVTVASTPGGKSLPVTIHDTQARNGSASIALTVQAPFKWIHEIQGSDVTSPFAGSIVNTNGIVTGVKSNG